MPEALPNQISGALWLSQRKAACLADEPRVGKTGTAIIAADLVEAQRVLVVTTASGRAVWEAAWREWGVWPRRFGTAYEDQMLPVPFSARNMIVSWQQLAKYASFFGAAEWDLLIIDESHYAKNPEAKRTVAAYELAKRAERVWCLTGTPIPNAPNDLWPMLRALAPERLGERKDYHSFTHRFCHVEKRWLGSRSVDVVKGGKNEAELAALLDGFMLRRTQADVGIGQPIYETFPIHISEAQRFRLEAEVEDADVVLAAAEAGDTKTLEMHIGPLRRITGMIKAEAVAAAVREEFECGLDKIVLMAWHTSVTDELHRQLRPFGPVIVGGITPAELRARRVAAFRDDPACRVFIGQIQAAGEAIDLSAAAELMFVEQSFVPKDMKQAALRITNHTQKRQCRVRGAAQPGRIDEAATRILVRKMASIREVLR